LWFLHCSASSGGRTSRTAVRIAGPFGSCRTAQPPELCARGRCRCGCGARTRG
jgi:hypothetical protein